MEVGALRTGSTPELIMKPAIGIDLGGTRIKFLAFDLSSGEVLETLSEPTNDGNFVEDCPAWLHTIKARVAKWEQEWSQPAEAIGICAPGIADQKSSCIISLPGRLVGIEKLDWAKVLGRADTVTILNDAHAALLGENWRGAALQKNNVLLLTLGTGVGGAAIVNGKLLTGHMGRGGHFGHMSLDPEGTPDCVGTPGSLEDCIGECTLNERSQGRYQDTETLLKDHLNGDPVATEIFEKSVKALAVGICSLINILDPETILLSGGITKANNNLLIPLKKELEKIEWRPQGHQVQLRIAENQEWSGAFGALYRSLEIYRYFEINKLTKNL